jgi:hypothetical protein
MRPPLAQGCKTLLPGSGAKKKSAKRGSCLSYLAVIEPSSFQTYFVDSSKPGAIALG